MPHRIKRADEPARQPARISIASLDLADSIDLAGDDIPELDATGENELELEVLGDHAEDIIGDTDGNDYRAGTVDPDGSDRGPYRSLSTDELEDVDLTRPH